MFARTTYFAVLTAVLAVAISGCDTGPKSGKGFRLPDGDVEMGKAAFAELKCYTCHRVSGVDFPPLAPTAPTHITLGGIVSRIPTYGELAASIINPSHGLASGCKKEQLDDGGLSLISQFNRVMTVEQMINLVAFVQSRYEKLEVNYLDYYP